MSAPGAVPAGALGRRLLTGRGPPTRPSSFSGRLCDVAEPGFEWKVCARCRGFKHLSEFPSSRRNRDGLYPYCRSCHAEYQRDLRAANPDPSRASAKRWREKNPQKVRALARGTAQRRRTRLRAVLREGYSLEEIWERDGRRCKSCGRFLSLSQATIDHVIPISAGGNDVRENVQCMHGLCNTNKGGARIMRENVWTAGAADSREGNDAEPDEL